MEFIFHLGNPELLEGDFEQMTNHYSGIAHKYFEDRIIEFRALNRLLNINDLSSMLQNHTSWNQCPEVEFKND